MVLIPDSRTDAPEFQPTEVDFQGLFLWASVRPQMEERRETMPTPTPGGLERQQQAGQILTLESAGFKWDFTTYWLCHLRQVA